MSNEPLLGSETVLEVCAAECQLDIHCHTSQEVERMHAVFLHSNFITSNSINHFGMYEHLWAVLSDQCTVKLLLLKCNIPEILVI